MSTSPLSHFFLNDTAPTAIYTLSLHDALPISYRVARAGSRARAERAPVASGGRIERPVGRHGAPDRKSNTSELQSPMYLVCRLLLEKKKHAIAVVRAPDVPLSIRYWYDDVVDV